MAGRVVVSTEEEELCFEVTPQRGGQRLDRLVAEQLPEWSRTAVKRLFAAGRVQVWLAQGRRRPAAKGESATAGDRIVVDLQGAWPAAADAPALADHDCALVVALERNDIVVVDKPAGQPCAPLAADERGTVANGLVARYPEMATVGHRQSEPGLCHRLDNDTSGLLLAARTEAAFQVLTAALRSGRLHKRYLLVCEESGLPDSGVIDLPLAPHPHNPRRVVACRTARERAWRSARAAHTGYRVLERNRGLALVEARATKALRHQLRAHFSAIGHAIAGDRRYGSAAAHHLRRHALHASHISWSGDGMVPPFRVRSPLPSELRELLK